MSFYVCLQTVNIKTFMDQLLLVFFSESLLNYHGSVYDHIELLVHTNSFKFLPNLAAMTLTSLTYSL